MKLGTIAYCTYLVHAPPMQAARALLRVHSRISPAAEWSLGGVLGIVMAVWVASLSWKLLEQRFIAYGHRFNY
jgi:peptidoglycan/LPS O-acetylase OafA/YrhL